MGFAALTPDQVHVAEGRKLKSYVADGIVNGGDRQIQDVVIKAVRRAVNPGYERVVLDLEGNRGGDSFKINRPPFFHVAVNPDEKRVVFTLFGHPRLGFDTQKVLAAFKKSPIVKNVELLPQVEDQSWTFVMNLKAERGVEVMELSNPVRIVLDVRN